MKKILVLNYEFPSLGGGAANAIYYLLKEFSNFTNLKIDLVTSSVDKFRIEKFSDNITIGRFSLYKSRISKQNKKVRSNSINVQKR